MKLLDKTHYCIQNHMDVILFKFILRNFLEISTRQDIKKCLKSSIIMSHLSPIRYGLMWQIVLLVLTLLPGNRRTNLFPNHEIKPGPKVIICFHAQLT